jgi:hypothetical protein
VNIEIREASTADIEPIFDLVRACIAGMRRRGIDQWDEVYPDRGIIERDVERVKKFTSTVADPL